MSNVEKLEGGDVVDRPAGVALYTALENCIDEIAPDNMTSFEVLGVLNVLQQRFYDENLSQISESDLLI